MVFSRVVRQVDILPMVEEVAMVFRAMPAARAVRGVGRKRQLRSPAVPIAEDSACVKKRDGAFCSIEWITQVNIRRPDEKRGEMQIGP
jgi:hypothetical protein